MSLKETIIKSLGLVEIKKGGTVRKGQTFYTIDSYEGRGRATVNTGTASDDFKVYLDGFYRESITVDDLNPGSLVISSEGLFFVTEISGVKRLVNSRNCIYGPGEIEIDEVIYYA